MRHLPDVLLVCGVLSVVTGSALIYGPAGWIVGGLSLIVMARMVAR